MFASVPLPTLVVDFEIMGELCHTALAAARVMAMTHDNLTKNPGSWMFEGPASMITEYPHENSPQVAALVLLAINTLSGHEKIRQQSALREVRTGELRNRMDAELTRQNENRKSQMESRLGGIKREILNNISRTEAAIREQDALLTSLLTSLKRFVSLLHVDLRGYTITADSESVNLTADLRRFMNAGSQSSQSMTPWDFVINAARVGLMQAAGGGTMMASENSAFYTRAVRCVQDIILEIDDPEAQAAKARELGLAICKALPETYAEVKEKLDRMTTREFPRGAEAIESAEATRFLLSVGQRWREDFLGDVVTSLHRKIPAGIDEEFYTSLGAMLLFTAFSEPRLSFDNAGENLPAYEANILKLSRTDISAVTRINKLKVWNQVILLIPMIRSVRTMERLTPAAVWDT